MSGDLRSTYPEPDSQSDRTAHAAWKRRVARSYAQHLAKKEGRETEGPELSALERRYGVRRERIAQIAAEYGIAAKPNKARARRAA